jgi:hypothetical protein
MFQVLGGLAWPLKNPQFAKGAFSDEADFDVGDRFNEYDRSVRGMTLNTEYQVEQ